jgi:hypothetical protein
MRYESGLHHSKQLSNLKTADIYSTISMLAFTGNAPKNFSTQSVCYIVTDEVYTNLVQISAEEAMGIKSNKNSPKQLTPVTIMVIDTISSVKSRILLKVLLDSGSTKTMINRKCLPRNCRIHGDTLPNTRGHIAKYMGTHCQIHGDTLPNTWGHIA